VFWQAWAWLIVLAISVFILAIAARTIKALIPAEASRLP
jgi:hypothetical protein